MVARVMVCDGDMSEKAMTKEEYSRSTPTGLSITHDNDTYSLFIYVPNISETILSNLMVYPNASKSPKFQQFNF